jgi:hypothetical protein
MKTQRKSKSAVPKISTEGRVADEVDGTVDGFYNLLSPFGLYVSQ